MQSHLNQKVSSKQSQMIKAFSCTVGRRGGGELKAGCCLPLPLLLFHLWGLCLVSGLCLALLSSCLHLLFSHLLCCFPPPPLPLFILLYLLLCCSQGLNLCLWSHRNTGMTTHTLPFFVSGLACWLAQWQAGVCVHTNVLNVCSLKQKWFSSPPFSSLIIFVSLLKLTAGFTLHCYEWLLVPFCDACLLWSSQSFNKNVIIWLTIHQKWRNCVLCTF